MVRGQRLIKLIFGLLISSLGMVFASEGPERFRLQQSIHDHKNDQVHGIYLDTLRQKLVVKTIKWNKDFEKRKGSEPQFQFPDTASTLTDYNSALLQTNPELSTKYYHYPLDTGRDYSKSRERLKEWLPANITSQLLKGLVEQMDRSNNRYKLLQVGKNKKKEIGIYYNSTKGEFVLKKVEGDPKKKFNFPLTTGLHFRANSSSSSHKTVESLVLNAKTLKEFDEAANRLKKELKRWGLKLPDHAFKEQRDQLARRLSDFVKIKSYHDDEEDEIVEAWYNPATNEIIYREFSTWGSRKKLRKEQLFSLNEQSSFEAAKKKFRYSHLFGRDEFDQFQGAINGKCEVTHTSPYDSRDHGTPGIQGVTDHLMEGHLKDSLAENIVVTENKELILNIKVLDINEQVKAKMDRYGQIVDLSFLKGGKKKKNLKIQKEIGIDGKPYFSLLAKDPHSGKWTVEMIFETTAPQGEGHKRRGHFLVQVRGAKAEGDFNYDDYETSKYPFDFYSRGGVAKVFPRERLNGNRPNAYDVRMSRNGSGGIKNFFFQVFFSQGGKRGKIEETIYDGAKEAILDNPDYGSMVMEREIKTLSREITNTVARRTDNFNHSTSRIEAVAAEESYTRFGDLILERTLKELLPGEAPQTIKDTVSTVMTGFKECLAKASKARNMASSNQCMDIFTQEAPVQVGKEILALKLRQADMGDFVSFSNRGYETCIQKRYDPLMQRLPDSHYREDDRGKPIIKEVEDSIDKIKGCLYEGIIMTVERAAPPMVDIQLKKVSEDMGVEFTFPQEKRKSSLKKMDQCFEKSGLAKKRGLGYQTDFAKLERMDPDIFEQGLFGCVDVIVVDVAKSIAETGLYVKLSEVEGMTSEKIKRISSKAMTDSFDVCLKTQKDFIAKQIDLYQREKERLRARGSKETPKIKVPKLEANDCIRSLTNYTVGLSAGEMIKGMFAPGEYEKIQSDPKKKFDIMACFENLNNQFMRELPGEILENPPEPEKLAEIIKARDKKADEKSAACVSKTIVWASEHIAPNVVKEKLAENPDYAKITLDQKANELIGRSVKNCLKGKLEGLKSVDSILDGQEKLTDQCGAQMLKDPKVQAVLFDPIIRLSLEKVDLKDEELALLVTDLRNLLGEEIKDATTVDEVMAKTEGFEKVAVGRVVDFMLSQNIKELVDDKQLAERIFLEVKDKLFSGSNHFGERLSAAMASKDDAKMEKVIGELTLEAAQIIAPHVVAKEANELKEQGIFKTDEEVKRMVDFTVGKIKDCLNSETQEKIDAKLDRCILKAKDEATLFVLNDQLDNKLNNDPLVSSHLDKKKIESLKKELLSEELKEKIHQLNMMEEGPEKKQKFGEFVFHFKAEATKKVFREVASGVIGEKLFPKEPKPSDITFLSPHRDRIAKAGADLMDQCLDQKKSLISAEVKKGEFKEKESEKHMDECMNRVRMNLVTEILPLKLDGVLAKVFGHTKVKDELSKDAVDYFTNCALKTSPESTSKEFEAANDACLNLTVFELVGSLVDKMRTIRPPIILKEEGTEEAIQSCRDQIQKKAIGIVYGDSGLPDGIKGEYETHKALILFEEKKFGNHNRIGLDWVLDELLGCVISDVAPEVLEEYRSRIAKDPNLKLRSKDLHVVDVFLSAFKGILGTRNSNGDGVRFDLSSWGLKEDSLKSEESYLKQLIDLEPLVFDYFKLLSGYDPKGMEVEAKVFENKMRSLIQSSDRKIPVGEVVDVLSNETELVDILVESVISASIRDEVTKALKKEGVSTDVVWLLSSKKMVKRLFGSGEGKKVVEKIKEQFIKPLLNGKLKDGGLPKDLLAEAKMILAGDTKKGGFAEVLFGAIAQKQLDQSLADIESGWFKWVKMSAAGWMGYNRWEDFKWGSPYSNSKYNLRNQPSGQKAVEYFAEKMLKPMLTTGLSDGAREKHSEKIEDLLKEAMEEND